MCLVADQAAEIGQWLRVVVRDADGRPTLDFIARVVWTHRRADGRYRMGLDQLATRGRAARGRPDARSRVLAVTA